MGMIKFESKILQEIQGREYLVSMLRSAEDVVVEFTKKDGTPRVMECTLDQTYIPEDKKPKSSDDVPICPSTLDAIRVFDLEKLEWRSFRWDSVTHFSINV
ncbi:WYL domain containing protein [uncultured Caudovirales phage]|uniref:WYL domain containing protein n=1 Tax=uncultured Caudovirales phage TaxID=2100421 RepID=A0A6J5PFS3_9CAUD|nr:WYL domain containing protein [uncultured Caudovirales phage]CAB4170861.1 WYL domain containing protein [uncultured Caudovirales phage]CAB4177121.1 WYL domain containing protein [uncultured Caudovirales phage]CAB4223072.1 WYL domain containing protein [uncultured Caudovirales phage]